MLRIVFRQLLKHWKTMLPVNLVWIIGGYFIFSNNHTYWKELLDTINPGHKEEYTLPNKHTILKDLSQFLVHFPEPGTENPKKAYFSYVRPALNRLKFTHKKLLCYLPSILYRCSPSERGEIPIRLDLMTKACAFIPSTSHMSDLKLQPHWLATLKEWSLSPGEDSITGDTEMASPVEYWKENQGIVLESLQDMINALSYAYVIPPEVHNESENAIVIPQAISRISAAVCKPELGVLAFGDFARHLEVHAFRIREEAQNPHKSELRTYPTEKEILGFTELGKNPYYKIALNRYLSGGVPDPLSPELCRGHNFILSCYSPSEALKTYRKLLYFSDESEKPNIFLNMGKLYLFRSLKNDDRKDLKMALRFLYGATRHPAVEKEGRILMIRIYLKEQDYRKAYDQLSQLSLVYRDRGMGDGEFRELARLTLIGVGRFRDADCFSSLEIQGFVEEDRCSYVRFTPLNTKPEASENQ